MADPLSEMLDGYGGDVAVAEAPLAPDAPPTTDQPGAPDGTGEDTPPPESAPEAEQPTDLYFDSEGNVIEGAVAQQAPDTEAEDAAPDGQRELSPSTRKQIAEDMRKARTGDYAAYRRLSSEFRAIIREEREGRFADAVDPGVVSPQDQQQEEISYREHDRLLSLSVGDPYTFSQLKYSPDPAQRRDVADFENFLTWKQSLGLPPDASSADVREVVNAARRQQASQKIASLAAELTPDSKLDELRDDPAMKVLSDEDWAALEDLAMDDTIPVQKRPARIEREAGRRLQRAENRVKNAQIQQRAQASQRVAQNAQATSGVPAIGSASSGQPMTFQQMRAENVQRMREGRVTPEWQAAYARAEAAHDRRRNGAATSLLP